MMGMGFVVMLLWVIFLVALVALIVWAFSSFFPGLRRQGDPAKEALRGRFARGEIDAEEYENTLEVLKREEAPQRTARARYLAIGLALAVLLLSGTGAAYAGSMMGGGMMGGDGGGMMGGGMMGGDGGGMMGGDGGGMMGGGGDSGGGMMDGEQTMGEDQSGSMQEMMGGTTGADEQ